VTVKIACAQLEPQVGNVAANRRSALDAIAVAAGENADLVVLPEQFSVGFFGFDVYEDAAEPIGGETHRQLADAAKTHEIAVLAGSIVEDLEATAETTTVPVPATEGLGNTSVLFDEEGNRQAVYRKAHLWGYDSREAELLVQGEELGVGTIGEFTIGITTCYDLRFPELYRRLLDAGVELVLVPSAWPFPRVEHWQTLPRARAIENLSYLAAVNGTGTQRGETLCGRSTVYDPWGTILASAGDEQDILTASLDPARLDAVRDRFPALRDRRGSLPD
jgi:predicted amidohydrolase